MQSSRNKVQFAFSGYFCVVLALMLLVLPLRWILAAILAAMFHEACHWLAVRLCGGKLQTFYLGCSGAVMKIDSMSRGKVLFCTLAGPLGGLVLLLLARWLPRTAVCAAFHSAYNLLPIFPLDGGRALRYLSEMLCPRQATRVCKTVSIVTLVFLSVFAVYGSIWLELGFTPLFLAAMLVFRSKKYLAKKSQTGYNGLNK